MKKTKVWSSLRNCNILQTFGEGSSLAFRCQHGPIECKVLSWSWKWTLNQPPKHSLWSTHQGNIWQACAVKYTRDPTLRLNFLNCMYENSRRRTYQEYKAASWWVDSPFFNGRFNFRSTHAGAPRKWELTGKRSKGVPRYLGAAFCTVENSHPAGRWGETTSQPGGGEDSCSQVIDSP